MNPENPPWKEITPFIRIKQNRAQQNRSISIQSSSPELFGDVKRICVELDIKLKRIEFRLAQSTTQWLDDFKKILNTLNPTEAWSSEVTSIYVRLGLNCKRMQSNSEERWRALEAIQMSIIKGESYSSTPYEQNGICLTLAGTLTTLQESELEAKLRTCNLPSIPELDTGVGSDYSISVGRVVFLLNCDSNLCNNWIQFYDNFRFETDKSGILREEWVAGNIQIRPILRNILEQWVSEKGQNATIGNLVDIVKRQYFTIATDLLQEEHSDTSIIQLDEESKYEPKYEPITSPGLVSTLWFGVKADASFKIYPDYLFQMLNKVKDLPVVIISINGKKRTGKSFMFNNFIKYLKWEWDNDNWIDSEIEGEGSKFNENMQKTSGIQVWSEPIRVKTNGREVAVIMIDTQDVHENSTIFAFYAMISSIFIYNGQQDVNHAWKRKPSSAWSSRSAKRVKKNEEEEEIVEEEESKQMDLLHRPNLNYLLEKHGSNVRDPVEFQKLVLLLRDFPSYSQYKYGYYDDETCAEGQVGNLKTVLSSPLTSLAQEITIYAMPSPGENLPDPPNHLSRSWEPEFRSHVISFVKQILSPTALDKATKRISGVEQTAESLRDFITNSTDRIQKGLPLIDSKPTEIELAKDFDTKLKFGGFVKPAVKSSFLSNLNFQSFLGQGTFGIVFKGIDESKTSSCIKFQFPMDHSDRETLRVTEHLRLLPSHENIVQIMDVEEKKLTSADIDKILKDLPYNERRPYIERVCSAEGSETIESICIKMELCGSNLRNWLNEMHDPDELHIQIHQTRIIQGMITGLQFLHTNKIIHCDLKPENIMFSRGRYQLPVKIGDFDLSRLIHSEESQTGSLTSGVGTRSYMAPEVVNGIYGQQADLYSLGLIIWEVAQLIEASERINLFDKLIHDRNEDLVEDHPIMRGIKEIIIGLTKPQTAERTKSLDQVNTESWEAALVQEVTRKGCKPLWDTITSQSEKNWNVKTSEEFQLALDNAREGCTIHLADGEYSGGSFVLWENGVKIVGKGAGTVLRRVDPSRRIDFLVVFGSECAILDAKIILDYPNSMSIVNPYYNNFLVVFGSECTISDIKIILDNPRSVPYSCTIVLKGDNSTVKNVEIASSEESAGIKIKGSRNTVDHVIMNNLQLCGILVEENSNSNTISSFTGIDLGEGIRVRGSNNNLSEIKLEKSTQGAARYDGVWLSSFGSSNTASNLTCSGYSFQMDDRMLTYDLRIDSPNTIVREGQFGSVGVWGKDAALNDVDCGDVIKISPRAEGIKLDNCRGKKLEMSDKVIVATMDCEFEEIVHKND